MKFLVKFQQHLGAKMRRPFSVIEVNFLLAMLVIEVNHRVDVFITIIIRIRVKNKLSRDIGGIA